MCVWNDVYRVMVSWYFTVRAYERFISRIYLMITVHRRCAVISLGVGVQE